MKPSSTPSYRESLSPRARLLTLLLPLLSSCHSCDEQTPEATPVSSASASVSMPALSSSVLPTPSIPAPIKVPVICMNGSLRRGWENTIIPRIAEGFREAGAKPVRVNPDNFESKKEECHGVMAVGGKDIDTTKIPQKENLHPKVKLMSERRQTFDEMFIRWARTEQMPVLAECLGAQEVVVWEGEGGGLIQHIPDVSNTVNHYNRHSVSLTDRASVFGLGKMPEVHSSHHQILKRPLPPSLVEVGHSSDDLVEAFISRDGLVWGIQWHPQLGSEQAVYQKFVAMVREQARGKTK